MTKTARISSLFLCALVPIATSNSFADDSGSKSLSSAVGSSDFFKLSCAVDTASVSFKLRDESLDSSTEIPPQVVNAAISSGGESLADLTANSGNSDETTLAVGNGKYLITLDTVGTNDVLTTPQTYAVEYQCSNSNGDATKSAGLKSGKVRKIKNSKKAKIAIRCKSNKKVSPSETASLHLKLTNTSAIPVDQWVASLPVLSGQVVNRGSGVASALNVSDLTGDDEYSQEINVAQAAGGSTDYYISVNNSGTSEANDNSKSYSFIYSCLNSSGQATTAGSLETLQDQ
ncbi:MULTISPECIES: hypothetical protein [Methylomonas]|uniref:hypothetical protein n=1 Tax=Methylomonas TaxID=416 RepID=UPI001232ED9E|nr:hypothetical protein [Methylomonas rhizoryzae]